MSIWLPCQPHSHTIPNCSADPDGEIRSICSENCIKEAMKLFQDCAPVKRGFLDFTQGRSPIHFLESDDADVDINASIQSSFDLLQRAKVLKKISWLPLLWVVLRRLWLLILIFKLFYDCRYVLTSVMTIITQCCKPW
jgi:hypothetical protein